MVRGVVRDLLDWGLARIGSKWGKWRSCASSWSPQDQGNPPVTVWRAGSVPVIHMDIATVPYKSWVLMLVLVRTAARMPGKNRAVHVSSTIKNISVSPLPPGWVCRAFFPFSRRCPVGEVCCPQIGVLLSCSGWMGYYTAKIHYGQLF